MKKTFKETLDALNVVRCNSFMVDKDIELRISKKLEIGLFIHNNEPLNGPIKPVYKFNSDQLEALRSSIVEILNLKIDL